MAVLFYILAVASLSVVALVVVRRFPQLASLDVQTLPEELEARKKKEILSNRIETQSAAWRAAMAGRFRPLLKVWGIFQLKFRIYVGKIERLLHHEERLRFKKKAKELSLGEQEEKLSALIKEGSAFSAAGDWEKAEEVFISAVKLNPKSAAAYNGLGDAYAGRGLMNEAAETYKFLLRLEPLNDSVMVKLAELLEKDGKVEEAIGFYQQACVINDSLSSRFYHLAELLLKVGQPEVAKEAIIQAVELEPKNPKYLDLLIEIAILVNDKALANGSYAELRLVNPDNNKLVEFKERIEAI